MPKRPFIFSTHSPVDILDRKKQRPLSVKSPSILRKLASSVEAKIKPLLQVKEEVDRVYSNGYFENHYPDADKTLKDTLHQKVLASWTTALNHIDDKDYTAADKPLTDASAFTPSYESEFEDEEEEEVDRDYSNDYFNTYNSLRDTLHKKALSEWTNALALNHTEDKDKKEDETHSGITIVIKGK